MPYSTHLLRTAALASLAIIAIAIPQASVYSMPAPVNKGVTKNEQGVMAPNVDSRTGTDDDGLNDRKADNSRTGATGNHANTAQGAEDAARDAAPKPAEVTPEPEIPEPQAVPGMAAPSATQ